MGSGALPVNNFRLSACFLLVLVLCPAFLLVRIVNVSDDARGGISVGLALFFSALHSVLDVYFLAHVLLLSVLMASVVWDDQPTRVWGIGITLYALSIGGCEVLRRGR